MDRQSVAEPRRRTVRGLLGGRPWWINLLWLFCLYMTFIYMPFDFFLKPTAEDREVWFGVGIDHDTASFAVNAIRRWWQQMGRRAYPRARSLVITADAGGSNGPRVRLWKWELQQLANRTGLAITVCHFPPGTSKWNKIEHRLFSHIAMNWRGTPLVSLAVIVGLIASTHRHLGLRVRSEIDRRRDADGVTVTDAQMATIRLTRHEFHGDWNYTIHPASKRRQSVIS